jgi:hypothetical protein
MHARRYVPLAAALFLFAGAARSQPPWLNPPHRSQLDRQRRIFAQYDPSADILGKGEAGSGMDDVMRYVFGYADEPGSQIDAICIDIANEGVAHYKSKILPPILHPGLVKWRAEGLDYFGRLIQEGHKRGKEMWWGLRMNEVERGHLHGLDGGSVAMAGHNPVKAAHPDWLLRSWWWQGHWNYAVKEVRDYRLSVIREVMEQYDFDGVHLDFLRHTPHLPPGRQWELRDRITGFLADARRVLQARAASRGRPVLLAARVPDSVKGANTDGLDIEAWAKRGLVDVLVIGTRTIAVDLASFRNATQGTPVKLLPSFDTFHATDGYQGPQPIELLRGVFGNYLHQGADGVGIFNYAAGSPEQAARLGLEPDRPSHTKTVATIGSLATIGTEPRFYAADRRGGYLYGEGYFSSNLGAQLPAVLRNDRTPTEVKLAVWEPVPAAAKAVLRVIVNRGLPKDHGVHLREGKEAEFRDELSVSFNGRSLARTTVDPGWKDHRLFCPYPQPMTMTPGALNKDLPAQRLLRIEFAVPGVLLRRGENAVAVSVKRNAPFPPLSWLTVEKLELHLE